MDKDCKTIRKAMKPKGEAEVGMYCTMRYHYNDYMYLHDYGNEY